MSIQKINPRPLVIGAMLVAVAALRVLFASKGNISPLTNFTPIGAMALFGGVCFSRAGKAFAWPLLALWLSDLFLNRFVYYGHWRFFYEGFYWTYGAFALMVLVGRLAIRRVTVYSILGAALGCTLIHWIITDLGVWLDFTTYPKTWDGWWTCLVAAIPFERNFLLGTLVYGTLLFGSFEWLKHRYHWTSAKVAHA